jgi:A/G-specific adenine glycosylase
MRPSSKQITEFQQTVWDYFRTHERAMPWRENPSPYYVLVSELMLQQTQVSRVIPKFHEFTLLFPTITELSQASLSEVLKAWNGLGYNRRAKFLWQAAQMIETDFGGVIPAAYQDLVKLPGIGPNTAGAMMVYAHNQPVIFVETNIRTVYFHHFFMDQEVVSDQELRDVVELTLDHEHPRQWFWALMDYGSYLKQTAGARLNQSKHYKKQSPLAGSLREMRGIIIRALSSDSYTDEQLRDHVAADHRYDTALKALADEGMIENKNGHWSLTVGNDTR